MLQNSLSKRVKITELTWLGMGIDYILDKHNVRYFNSGKKPMVPAGLKGVCMFGVTPSLNFMDFFLGINVTDTSISSLNPSSKEFQIFSL